MPAFGGPVAISFGHEMNGNWYPWGTSQATPAEFVAAWRHIHDLFAAAGATNVIWVWNPNIVNPMPDVELAPYWPGDAYVDWVGITGYFPTTGPDTFAGVYGPTMAEVRKFTSKPFIIAETAVQTGPDEVASIRSLIDGVGPAATCSASSGSSTTRPAWTGRSPTVRQCARRWRRRRRDASGPA